EKLQKYAPLEMVITAAYSDYTGDGEELEELPGVVAAKAQEFEGTIPWKKAMKLKLIPSIYGGESDDIAVLPYTSGTTGLPKGCIHTNHSVQANTVGTFHWMNMTSDAVAL